MSKEFSVTGMTCAACSARVEKAAKQCSGVQNCCVNLLTGDMSLDGEYNEKEVIQAVMSAGYGCKIKDKATENIENAGKKTKKLDADIVKIIVSAILLAALMCVSMLFKGIPFSALAVLQAAFAGSIIVLNFGFFKRGFKAAIGLSPNMDTLVSLGAAVSYVYSIIITILNIIGFTGLPKTLYFGSAGMILTFISVGKFLEKKAKKRAVNSIAGLMSLSPKTAMVEDGGDIREVSVAELEIGDVFLIKPGDLCPIDGEVISGASEFDESSLTGESLPSAKNPGDSIFAGTLNITGLIKGKVTKKAGETTLSEIIKTVEKAQITKAPISRVADKVAGIFVPAVILISALTFVIHYFITGDFTTALSYGISVLVVSCPCAMGLATPVAILCGSTVAAENGILFKNAASIETLGKIKNIAFDKTGTVTEGKFAVVKVWVQDSFDEKTLFSYLGTAEFGSGHPISEAVFEYAKNKNIHLEKPDFSETLAGKGIIARLCEKRIICGNYQLLKENGIALSEICENDGTIVYVACGNSFIGAVTFADKIKPDAKKTIDLLKKNGINVYMLSGDNEKTAFNIASQAGIEQKNVYAKLLPNDKCRIVETLSKSGLTAMVGDGINDAPALTCAGAGIAIGTGTDIAVESAEIVISGSSLDKVAFAALYSKRILKTIYLNLFWAFGYNIIGIPLAAGLFEGIFGLKLTPGFSALCMSLSSFLVVTNSLRLLRVKKDKEVKKKMAKMVLKVNGMMCHKCEAHVIKAIQNNFNVSSVTADFTKSEVVVIADDAIDGDKLKKVIEEEDYEFAGCINYNV